MKLPQDQRCQVSRYFFEISMVSRSFVFSRLEFLISRFSEMHYCLQKCRLSARIFSKIADFHVHEKLSAILFFFSTQEVLVLIKIGSDRNPQLKKIGFQHGRGKNPLQNRFFLTTRNLPILLSGDLPISENLKRYQFSLKSDKVNVLLIWQTFWKWWAKIECRGSNYALVSGEVFRHMKTFRLIKTYKTSLIGYVPIK